MSADPAVHIVLGLPDFSARLGPLGLAFDPLQMVLPAPLPQLLGPALQRQETTGGQRLFYLLIQPDRGISVPMGDLGELSWWNIAGELQVHAKGAIAVAARPALRDRWLRRLPDGTETFRLTAGLSSLPLGPLGELTIDLR